MIAALAGLVLPVAVAWWVLRAFALRPATDSRLTRAGVACCLGIGFSSLTTFAAVTLGFFPGPAFVATDAAGWVILGVLARRRARRTPLQDPLDDAPAPGVLAAGDWLARGAFVVVAAAALAVPVIEYLAAAPHGQWDAWAIWNQKARFLYRAGDGWTVSMALSWAQPGHPVLVSASVARLWAYAGGELTAVPALLSGVYGATVVAVVMGALNVRRTRAWVAGSVLVAPFAFSHLVAAQTADLPVAMLVVASLAMLRQDDALVWRDHRRARSAMLLAGVLGGLAMWTKNEGAVFLLASGLLVAWIALRHGHARDMLWWAAGAAPILAVVAWFKLILAAAAPPVYGPSTTAAALGYLLSPDRHERVIDLMWPLFLGWGGPWARWSLPLAMCAALAMALTPAGRSGRGILMVVALMLIGYYSAYLVSSMELVHLVTTTYERLIMQVWPAMILAAVSVGEPAAAALPARVGGGN
jgi:hypothetical protein